MTAAVADAAALESFAEQAALRLGQGLRSLRAQGAFCDLRLSTDSEQCLAHQAVLAALSKPLREKILANSKGQIPPSPELATAPQPLEIKLASGTSLQAKAVQTLLDHCYGEELESEEEKNQQQDGKISSLQLLAALQVEKSEALELADGLQKLQKESVLCDLLLNVGGEHIPAHQVVLASANGHLRNLIVEGMQNLKLAMSDGHSVEAASHTLELELRGIENAEAVRVLLDFLYGRPSWVERKLSAAACRDVLQLATELRLPSLQEQGLLWSRTCESAATTAPAGGDEEEEEEEEEAGTPQGEGTPDRATEELATPEPADITLPGDFIKNELRAAEKYLSLRTFKFNSKEEVPEPPSSGAVELAGAMGELESKWDTNFLAKLVQLFWERSIWLEPVLKQAPVLGRQIDSERLQRFLPLVAYQCKDGPWQSAYVRLGYDPREDPEEAMKLQVLDFRDKHFKGEGKSEAKEYPDGSEDVFFKKPPTLRSQLYQLADIDDEIVQSLVDSAAADPSSSCDRKHGFFNPLMVHMIAERLDYRSKELREKAAKRESRGGGGGGVKRAAAAGGKAASGKRARQ
eukprot:TRINITY_DN87292_c0_g1_i1.p1 TRINITY_DN87292_c0_g1~~TRINITY_DN87292_c0_g1_i1.p1  ORF type:complete len:577 (-),score=165.11 TRINITY_DN87292_c0_g1_i1:58-1788(-)